MTKQKESLRIAYRNSSAMDEFVVLRQGRTNNTGVELKWGFRRVPLSRGRHHGGYVCAFRNQPILRVESALERHVLKALSAEAACIALATQPVTIQWVWRGALRRYTPDILAMFDVLPDRWHASGMERSTLIEVKPDRFYVEDDLWRERIRIIRVALGIPLMRLPSAQEVLL